MIGTHGFIEVKNISLTDVETRLQYVKQFKGKIGLYDRLNIDACLDDEMLGSLPRGDVE
jgi:hypothetical protein